MITENVNETKCVVFLKCILIQNSSYISLRASVNNLLHGGPLIRFVITAVSIEEGLKRV